MSTKIEWTDETWNPITGCSPVSEGCQNCYAKRMANRLRGRYGYPKEKPFTPAIFHPDKIGIKLFIPGKRVFLCSMGDLFHDAVNIRGDEIREVFRCMAHHDNIFILLTKRPTRMRDCIRYLYGDDFAEQMPHVWIGVTAENQKRANERVPVLLQIPARVHFVSVEPMLGHIDLRRGFQTVNRVSSSQDFIKRNGIDWVICGAETGPGARHMDDKWAFDLFRQCKAANVPFFFKKASKGSVLNWDKHEFPAT